MNNIFISAGLLAVALAIAGIIILITKEVKKFKGNKGSNVLRTDSEK